MIIVLGPQRRPTLDAVGLDGPGRDDHGGLAGARARRRRARRAARRPQPQPAPCYARWQDVLERDPEYAEAERAHRAALAEQQELHLVQLDGVLGALREVARRGGSGPRVRDEARADAEAVVRLVDDRHLARVAQERAAFARPVAARGARGGGAGTGPRWREVLAGAAALAVAGGHVGVLGHVLRLFARRQRRPTVVAWSAGAMALTDRVLLFHDRAANGPSHAEFADVGAGLDPRRGAAAARPPAAARRRRRSDGRAGRAGGARPLRDPRRRRAAGPRPGRRAAAGRAGRRQPTDGRARAGRA